MTYRTHAYFGTVLYPILRETWGFPLSRKRLVKGSIKPDMSSLFIRYPHFWKRSHKFVERKMRKLGRMTLSPGKKNGKFCETLGIVLHYVADYFTAVHNASPNPIREHMEYETRLHALFIERVDEESLRTSMRLISCGIDPPLGDADHGPAEGAKRALRELRAAYRPDVADPANDIRFITVACLTVAARIMDAATGAYAVDMDISRVSGARR
jgi:hypothetical protein